MDSETISLITVPLFTGAIGYVTNWTGVWMLFYPVRFAGFRLPGLAPLAHFLLRRVQQIPGVMQGGVEWQGIIPSRAAKMGSIAVDKGIAKLGSPASSTGSSSQRILSQLAPDEARILRLLAQRGAQPSVDVRSGWLPFAIGSELVAPGLTMIGEEAGRRYPERVQPYLNNLYRLGLLWFSREPVADPLRYQVLEAQPEVTQALQRAGRGRTVRRSIHLTPFGKDFCEAVLPLDTAEFEAVGADG
jgi:hypothetical protein